MRGLPWLEGSELSLMVSVVLEQTQMNNLPVDLASSVDAGCELWARVALGEPRNRGDEFPASHNPRLHIPNPQY